MDKKIKINHISFATILGTTGQFRVWNYNDEAGFSQVLHLETPNSMISGSESGSLVVTGGLNFPYFVQNEPKFSTRYARCRFESSQKASYINRIAYCSVVVWYRSCRLSRLCSCPSTTTTAPKKNRWSICCRKAYPCSSRTRTPTDRSATIRTCRATGKQIIVPRLDFRQREFAKYYTTRWTFQVQYSRARNTLEKPVSRRRGFRFD